jgi:hypothetical protein
MDAELANAVSVRSPRYNEYLLRNFLAEQISGAAQFIEIVFKEAVKLFSGVIEYIDMRVLLPEERAEKELEYKKGCPITTSELQLIEYRFAYQGQMFPVLLYIPYLKDDVIKIEDTTYVLQRSIKEKVFSKTMSGITMKVIRQPIPFYRTNTYRLESVSDSWYKPVSVPTTAIYNQARSNRRRMIDVTIIHYLLCKFGFVGLLEKFNLTKEDVEFVTIVGGDVDEYRYFAAKKAKSLKQVDLFLKVRKSKLEDPIVTKLVANILYTVTAFHKHQVEHLYEATGSVFRIMLGKIIYGVALPEIQCKSKIDTHIASLDTYLDPITRARLLSYDIQVTDIYDTLRYVFCEIDNIFLRTSHTDLYNSRIDVMEELLVETIVKSIYARWYRAETDPKKLSAQEIRSILNFPRDLINGLHKSRIVQKNPPAYGDNGLVGWQIQKIRQSGLSTSGRIIKSPDHRFHTSMAAVETLVSFSKSNPGAGGAINPFLIISENGSVIRQSYSDEIDALGKDLPY